MTDSMRSAIQTILRGFDEGVFVRSTDNDLDPAWAIKLFPFIQALAVTQRELKCDCVTSGNVDKPKQMNVDPHAKNCAVYR
jgi:hypothetical protein